MGKIGPRKVGEFDPKKPWKRLPHPEVQKDSLMLKTRITRILKMNGFRNLDIQPYTQLEPGINIRLKPREVSLKDPIITCLLVYGAMFEDDKTDTLIYEKKKITISVVSKI